MRTARVVLLLLVTVSLAACDGNPLKKSSMPTYELQEKIKQSYSSTSTTPEQDATGLFKDVCLAGLSDSWTIKNTLLAKSTQYRIVRVSAQGLISRVPGAANMPLTDNNWYIENLQNGWRYFVVLTGRENCLLYTTQPSGPLKSEFEAMIPKLASALNVSIEKLPRPKGGIALLAGNNQGEPNIYKVNAWDDRIDGATISLVASLQAGGLSLYAFNQHPGNYEPALKYTPHYVKKKEYR